MNLLRNFVVLTRLSVSNTPDLDKGKCMRRKYYLSPYQQRIIELDVLQTRKHLLGKRALLILLSVSIVALLGMGIVGVVQGLPWWLICLCIVGGVATVWGGIVEVKRMVALSSHLHELDQRDSFVIPEEMYPPVQENQHE